MAASEKQALDLPAGAARAAATAEYRRRDPQGGVLHRVLRENLETFLARAQGAGNDGRGVPGFVADELRSHLRCGVLAHGLGPVQKQGDRFARAGEVYDLGEIV
ncbi:MAG: hypothetical protein OEY17_06605 [Nitrosopumilus sp.]|nr:hypothetical protein [Nitrosopumilus sp.]